MAAKVKLLRNMYEWVDLAKSEEENTLDLGNISTNLDNVKNFKDKWFECFCQHVVTNEGEIKLDNDVIWWGQLSSLYDDKIRDDWRLSILQNSQSLKKETKLFRNRNTAGESESKLVFNNKINVLYEMKKESLPMWRILPFQFVLYHNSLMKRVLEIKESEDKSFDELFEENENVFMASLALRDQKSEGRTKKDWIKFIMNNEGENEYENRCGQHENEARHLILYPVEAGIFLAYFLREENIPLYIILFSLVINQRLHQTKNKN
ncbi:uncharacterized protein LOC124437035 [Xenia sp. Carnegie-2017]|uniref:uncharacterized protein LOC124437035 n=1 Tax=Xenia sp. Carnegie-2017 TaxID=2897299 RepID=UPI001F03CA0B|nr:uncharacterized protein LOC124437035 [Xenia sp. Carnegie-2017]